MKVHKGDTVLVISGKDKGAKGKVIAAYPATNKVLVEGVNRIKKHTAVSANERGASSGGIVTQEAPIHVSNVAVIDYSKCVSCGACAEKCPRHLISDANLWKEHDVVEAKTR